MMRAPSNRRMAALPVIALLVAACGSGSSSPPAREPVDPVRGGPVTSFRFPPAEGIVNPEDPATGRRILVDRGGACYTEDASARTKTACPAELAAPEIAKKCAERLVLRRGDTCQCEVFGDPPYIGVVPCPG